MRADDGRVVTRLRETAERRIDVTVFAGSQDRRARRLARAADAELGAISPDAHLPVVLCPDGPPRDGIIGAQILVVPVDDGDDWRVLFPDGRVGRAVDGESIRPPPRRRSSQGPCSGGWRAPGVAHSPARRRERHPCRERSAHRRQCPLARHRRRDSRSRRERRRADRSGHRGVAYPPRSRRMVSCARPPPRDRMWCTSTTPNCCPPRRSPRSAVDAPSSTKPATTCANRLEDA